MELSNAPHFGDGALSECFDWNHAHPIATCEDVCEGVTLHIRALDDLDTLYYNNRLSEPSYRMVRKRLERNIRRLQRLNY